MIWSGIRQKGESQKKFQESKEYQNFRKTNILENILQMQINSKTDLKRRIILLILFYETNTYQINLIKIYDVDMKRHSTSCKLPYLHFSDDIFRNWKYKHFADALSLLLYLKVV